MLGTLLDRRYRTIKVLGSGGFGQTYVAQDTHRPGQPWCVVKHLKPASEDSTFLQVARRLFNTEAAILEKLGHHGQIPQLLAYFEEDHEFYLVQELIEGQTLSEKLANHACLSETEVVHLLQDLLEILDFVHAHQVIHRDIKPSNIICRPDGKLVLIDFGAVKELRNHLLSDSEQTSLMTVGIGTQGYVPVEQLAGRPRFNSDIYAVGMVGIRALTGLEPTQLPEDFATGEILWREHAIVSEPLATILDKMVRSHFSQRYSSAREVLQDLERMSHPIADLPHPTFVDLAITELPPVDLPPTGMPIQDLAPRMPLTVLEPTPVASQRDQSWQVLVGLGAATVSIVAVLAAIQSLGGRSPTTPALSETTQQTIQAVNLNVSINYIRLDNPIAGKAVRHGEIEVPDRDTTVPVAGYSLRHYDVHIAKMLELSHQFYCAEPYAGGTEKVMVWKYTADNGKANMGTFTLRCTTVEQAIATYGLAKAQRTKIHFAGSSEEVAYVPTLDLRGDWKVNQFQSFVQTLKPTF